MKLASEEGSILSFSFIITTMKIFRTKGAFAFSQLERAGNKIGASRRRVIRKKLQSTVYISNDLPVTKGFLLVFFYHWKITKRRWTT